MAINKVVYGTQTLIDLTGDTVEAGKILDGYTAHDKAGEVITGTCTFDVDSQDGTAAVAEILSGKSAYARGVKLVGTMPNKGAVSGSIANAEDHYPIPMGFHDGSGSVGIDSTEKAKLKPGNIKQGIEILGVTGTYGGEAINTQSKTVTPKTTSQVVQPDEGYDYLAAVTVEAIPYTESDNAAGGKTVTIAG